MGNAVCTRPELLSPQRDRRRLGGSIWLLLLLRSWRTSSGGDVRAGNPVRAGELATALGMGERQVRRDLRRLRRNGLIEVRNTGRGFAIRLAERGRG